MSITRLGMLLSTAGFQAVRKQIGGIRLRGWAVYQHMGTSRSSNIINFYIRAGKRFKSNWSNWSKWSPPKKKYIYQPF